MNTAPLTYWTPATLAKRIGFAHEYITRRCQDGKIPSIRNGSGQYLIEPRVVDRVAEWVGRGKPLWKFKMEE